MSDTAAKWVSIGIAALLLLGNAVAQWTELKGNESVRQVEQLRVNKELESLRTDVEKLNEAGSRDRLGEIERKIAALPVKLDEVSDRLPKKR